MPNTNPQRVVFHGAVVLLVGLLSGFMALTEGSGGPQMSWRAVHFALLMSGIWLIATAPVLPMLVLDPRSASALPWSLVATAYGFMTTLLVQALTGVRGLEPGGSPAEAVAFAGNVVAVLCGLLAALLTLQGAHNATKRVRAGVQTAQQ